LEKPGEVHVIPDELCSFADKNPGEFRSAYLFDLGGGVAEKIIVHADGGSDLVLENSSGEWFIRSPLAWPADAVQVGRLLRSCQNLRAEVINPADEKQSSGFARAAYVEIVCGGKTHRVSLLPGTKEGVALALHRERGIAAEVDGSLLEEAGRVCQQDNRDLGVNRYRQRVLDLLNGRTPAFISVQTPDGTLELTLTSAGWKASGARDFPVEEASVKQALAVFAGFEIAGFIADGAVKKEDYGLAPPRVRAE